MTLIILLLAIGALIGWAAYKSNWEPKATIAAVIAFLGAIWAAFWDIGALSP